jgi:hypothetical protein
MRRSAVTACPSLMALWPAPFPPRSRPDRRRRPRVGRTGSQAISRCGPGGAKAGRVMLLPPSWASARVRCFALCGRPPCQSGSAGAIAAAVSSRPINRLAWHSGTRAAGRLYACMARANGGASREAIPPSPATPSACARRRARHRDRGQRRRPSRSWPSPPTNC